jgi:peptidoglycan/LPS O-acetylase OafA/YrhL
MVNVAVKPEPGPPADLPPATHSGRDQREFRSDIEGLRAVAVLVVVLFHAGIAVLGGGYVGVDVFFVISGFLITSQLLREIVGTGRISIPRFYARRVLRLLPVSSFVVAATLMASWLWLPPLRVIEITRDALATTVYGLNYRLALTGTDYLSATAEPSPLQHFWSLAVEEQFYLLWPPVLLLAARARRRRTGAVDRTSVLVVLGIVMTASFGLSLWQTRTSAPWAYFGAHTRAWELATGATVAVCAPALARLPRRAAVVGRWAGLAAIIAAALTLTERTPFPGYAAAWPVLATALLIATGCADSTSRVLGAAPLQMIGKLSYGWYLWHWPVLIVAPHVFGALTVPKTLCLAGLSLLLAVVTARRVEEPVRTLPALRRRARTGVAVGAGLSIAVASLAVVVPSVLPRVVGNGHADDTASLVGGSTAQKQLYSLVERGSTTNVVPANLKPAADKANADLGAIYPDGCDPAFADATVKKPCLYGDPAGVKTVVLFGDSHAGHWFPAVNQIAQQRHWKLAVVTKSACSAASVSVYLKPLKRAYTECDQWRIDALRYIGGLAPAVVFVSSNGHGAALNVGRDQDAGWAAAWTTTFEKLPSAARLVFISDTAWPKENVPECVSNHLTAVTECQRSRDEALSDGRRRNLVADATHRRGGLVVDPVPWMCGTKMCPVIVGNVLVYRDDSHISATFSLTVAPLLAQQVPAD